MATNKSQDGVVVACKLPHGLHLDVNTSSGVKRITLAGGNDPSAVGGYGFTQNVDPALFGEWVKQNGQHPAMARDANVIFVVDNIGDARAKADEQEEVKTGFEGVDTTQLPFGIETAESQKKG